MTPAADRVTLWLSLVCLPRSVMRESPSGARYVAPVRLVIAYGRYA